MLAADGGVHAARKTLLAVPFILHVTRQQNAHIRPPPLPPITTTTPQDRTGQMLSWRQQIRAAEGVVRQTQTGMSVIG